MSALLMRPQAALAGASATGPVFGSPIDITNALITSNGSNVFSGLVIENTSYSANNGAAIYVTASQPVIIENCTIRAQKYGVSSLTNGSNVTVRNCLIQIRNTTQAGQPAQRAVNLGAAATFVIENNTFIGGGILIYQQATGGMTLGSIRYNRMLNIDGRLSDGAGGYVFERANTANVYFQAKQFLQMNEVRGATNVEVAWNQIENDPFVSRPEDNINIYGSSGTSGSPINIHDNIICGGWSSRPHDLASYSGGGIICDRATATDWTDEAAVATKWVNIDDNQVVGLVQHGISAPYGNNINARRNRIICPNKLQGRTILSANVGAYVGGALVAAVRGFTNNLNWDSNVIGCLNAGGSQNNTSISSITASGVASASSGTKTRVTLTHGLSSGDNGRTLPVYSGANWTPGDYVLTYVDATHLDLDVAWNASFGNPVIRSRTVDITNTTSFPAPTEYDVLAERAIFAAKLASNGIGRLGSSLAPY